MLYQVYATMHVVMNIRVKKHTHIRKRLGRGTLNTRAKNSGTISQKRRGHWNLKEFAATRLNQTALLFVTLCFPSEKVVRSASYMMSSCPDCVVGEVFFYSYELLVDVVNLQRSCVQTRIRANLGHFLSILLPTAMVIVLAIQQCVA